VFAAGEQLLHNANVALFAAFGSVTMLLFVRFGGGLRQQLTAQVPFAGASLGPVFPGTASSQLTWAAAALLAFSFVVLFSGVISSPLAAAAPRMLISFLLPAAIPAPIGMAPDRLVGWLLAGGATLAATALVPPSPLAGAAAAACRALSAQIAPDLPPGGPRALAGSPVENLRQAFFRSPYRPAGLGTGPRMLVQAVQQIFLLDRRTLRCTCDGAPAAVLMAATSAVLSDSARLLSG